MLPMVNRVLNSFLKSLNRLTGLSDRQALMVIYGLSALIIVGFLLSIPLPRCDHHLIGSDGLYYYAYLPSLIIDHDLDLENQYEFYRREGIRIPYDRTSTGLSFNVFQIGPAILWSPFFLIAHLLSQALSLFGIPVPLHGYSYIYEAGVCLGSIFYGIAGVLLLYQVCRHYFDPMVSLLAVVGFWFSSSLLYYMLVEPSMSHSLSFFASALFLFQYMRMQVTRRWFAWVLLGGSIGIVTLIRPQESLFALLTIGLLYQEATSSQQVTWSELAKKGGCFLLTVLLVFLPQMVVWKVIFGTFITIPQGSAFFSWTEPHFWEVLLSTRHGLFTWTPITLLGILGLVTFIKRDRWMALAALTAFVLQVYVNSIAVDWWAGDAFGGRRFLGTFPFLLLGLASLINTAWQRGRGWHMVVAGTLVGLLIWNGLFMIQYRFGFIPRGDALTFHQLVTGKFTLPFHVMKIILNLLINSG